MELKENSKPWGRKDTWRLEPCQPTGEPWPRAVFNPAVPAPATCQLKESALDHQFNLTPPCLKSTIYEIWSQYCHSRMVDKFLLQCFSTYDWKAKIPCTTLLDGDECVPMPEERCFTRHHTVPQRLDSEQRSVKCFALDIHDFNMLHTISTSGKLTTFYKFASGRRSTSYSALSYTKTIRADPSPKQEVPAVYADQHSDVNASGIDNKSLCSLADSHCSKREHVEVIAD